MEWIPYENLKQEKDIDKGGFATVHSAIWSNGPIEKREEKRTIALKYVKNSKIEIDNFLKEVEPNFEITDNSAFIRCLGISQQLDILGNLRDENHKRMTWKDKITALFTISMGLKTFHKSQLIHHEFHS
ncbi:23363_t:CDS:2 [Gigaspora margarita]|uniref:23363_t:CDS:1 n=1 Tax=Gigaspora margarita TaxID=4874 RepID=A0ABN7UES1_GIGMA|nr:23363_t:CDS:2 [Gigaspora margarita]